MVVEALLEMHFHRALLSLFEQTFGARVLRLIKPSTRREAWVGFDQGWVRTTISEEALLRQLREAIASPSASVPNFYLGYFLQFKCVERMSSRSRYCPPSYSTPYYRAELSLSPNRGSGLSQHETLLRLSGIHRADVNYACCMLFESDEIYDDPDLDKLRVVPVTSGPSGWVTNERHFITFQNVGDATPFWMSEPHEARSVPVTAWVRQLSERQAVHDGPHLAEWIDNVKRLLVDWMPARSRRPSSAIETSILPSCMSIVELTKGSDGTPPQGDRT